MKKLFSLILMFAIVLLPISALAAPGDAILLRQGEDGYDSSLRGMAEADGRLYILTYDALYTLESGASKPERHELELETQTEATQQAQQAAPQAENAADATSSILSDVVGGVLNNLGAEPQADETAAEAPEEAASVNREAVAIVVYGAQPCLIVSETTKQTYGSGMDMEYVSSVEGVWLCELAFNDAGAAVAGKEIVELDWSNMLQEYGDSQYPPQCSMPFVMGDTLYFSSYDYNGNEYLAMCDLTDGSSRMLYTSELDVQVRLDAVCPYKDGKLLTMAVEWSEDGNTVRLYALDVNAAALEELLQLPSVGYGSPSGLVYREENDTLYYIMNGEVHALTGMDVSTLQAVAEIPVDSVYEAMPIVTDDGFYVAGDYEAVVRRNTDPTLRAQTRLTVQNNYNTSIESAYYAFTSEHGDVEVVLAQQTEDVVQAMMNRSSAVDVYCLDVSTSQYEAVFSRGFMADLSQSEALAALVESAYPFVQEVCKKDGQVVGVPVEMYMDGRGYDPEAFERLGLTEADVPQTWAQFFESLEPLAARVAQTQGMSLFETYYDYESLRMTLLNALINEYMVYISQPEREFAFDTEGFRAALAAYEAVDWENLGQPSPEDEMIATRDVSAPEHNVLFSTYASVTASSYSGTEGFQPLPLGFEQGEQASLGATMYVAFVNPFSENREAAVAFLETVAENLDPLLKIHISPENNEPVRSAYYETNLAGYDQSIADIQAQLEAADTESDRQAFEEMLAEMEGYREEYMRYGAWDASEESIARYRQFAPYFRVKRNLGLGDENADEFYELISQYMDGMISADELIAGVDRKLQMMIKEGM
ncbi:MAG TPA: carbohydrate ABC transporter substrate-binding protein [Candidatus Pullichristensenella avicola]|nr:carbohydrate ABC transporter substrate-binding protein [Candidatus Pullichristensenella avicola]